VAELAPRYRGQVATASRIANTFNATNKQSMSKTYHIKRGSANTLQLVYFNGYCNAANTAAEETARGSSATYKVSLEYPIGTAPRLFTWSGAAQINAASGALIITDEMPFDVPDGALCALHCYQTATAGIIYTTFPTTRQGAVFEGMTFGVSGIVDYTETIGGDPAPSADFGTPPLAIIGWTRRPAVALFGDSRVAGTGAPGDTGDYTTNTGTYARSIGKSLAYINLGVPSSKANGLRQGNAVRMSLLQYVTGAIVAIGVNDYRSNGDSGTTIYNNLQLIANQIVALRPGIRLFFGTIEPYTTASTDAYASGNPGTQTIASSDSSRTSVNESLRLRGILGASGIMDVTSVLEGGVNTSLWIGGGSYPLTGDGLHANQRGCLAVEKSGVVNPSLFVR